MKGANMDTNFKQVLSKVLSHSSKESDNYLYLENTLENNTLCKKINSWIKKNYQDLYMKEDMPVIKVENNKLKADYNVLKNFFVNQLEGEKS